jgi:hypothetical protein
MTDDEAWNVVYHATGFDVADWLDTYFPLKRGDWRSSQHGEAVWIKWHDGAATYRVIDRLDLWRQEVACYFASMASQRGRQSWKTLLPVFIYQTLRVFLYQHHRWGWDLIEREATERPPRGADRWILW